MRYEIHAVANENCDSIDEAVLASCDDPTEAKRLALRYSTRQFGAAILDTHKGKVDYGEGFEDCPQYLSI